MNRSVRGDLDYLIALATSDSSAVGNGVVDDDGPSSATTTETEEISEESESVRKVEHTETNTERIRKALATAMQHLREEEFNPTFAAEPRDALGCQHYLRSCKLFAECCQMFVTCRVCHDEALGVSHKMNRHAVKSVLCMACQSTQPVGPKCLNKSCSVGNFSTYYCDVCHLYDDSGIDIYHCIRCGICRQGRREHYFHCFKCDACISVTARGAHKCAENSFHAWCPCCMEDMFSSREPAYFMKCGHAMHDACYQKYIESHFRCPLCQKTINSMHNEFRALDEVVQRERNNMTPAERRRTVRVFCQDCEKTSSAPYHFQYFRCQSSLVSGRKCNSYNTRVVWSRCQHARIVV